MEKRPLELRKSKVDTYLLTVKQELRSFMQQSPFTLKTSSEKKEIERYSDKHKQFKGNEIDNFIEWHPDWKFFPDELRIGVKRRKRTSTEANFRPTVPARKKARKDSEQDGNSSIAEEEKDDMIGGNHPTSEVKKVTFADENKK